MSQATPPDTTGDSPVIVSGPYLEHFAQLASPVLDLAATLATSHELEADDENVSFLRTRLPTPPTDLDSSTADFIDSGMSQTTQMPTSATIPPLRDARTGQVISRTGSESQRRTQNLTVPQQATSHSTNAEHTWASRTFGHNYPGYAGWAPGSSDEEEEPIPISSNNTQSSAQVYNEWSSRMRELRAARSTRGDLSQLLEQVIETQNELDAYMRPTREARQALQTAARSRNHLPLPQYLLERERHGEDNEDNDRRRPQRNHDRNAMILEQQRQQQQQQQRQQQRQQQLLTEMQQRVSRAQNDSHRQRSTDMPSPGARLKPLEDAIKYLGYIRSQATEEERIEAAMDAGLLHEGKPQEWNDFVCHTIHIEPPPESSWLKPGGSFAGTQRAAGAACLHLPYLARGPHLEASSRRRMRSERLYQEEFERATTYAAARTSNPGRNRALYSTELLNPQSLGEKPHDGEEWPVKVVIHGVNYSDMTLTGTMEASNVPDKTSPSHESSITTYLEGEIIDFNLHSLETKTFNANARVDGTYWRKLEPFKQLSDEQMVKNLLSKSWINDVLMKNWVLMRWKGRERRPALYDDRLTFVIQKNVLSSRQMHNPRSPSVAFTTCR